MQTENPNIKFDQLNRVKHLMRIINDNNLITSLLAATTDMNNVSEHTGDLRTTFFL